MKRQALSLRSILLVDDSQESLDLYSSILRKKSNCVVICSKYPSEAIKLANKHFFDIVLIDVTINYNGTQFGGIEVYKSLKSRYGDASLIVYSQYITDDLLKQYEYEFNFIEKKEDPQKFVEEVLRLMNTLRKRQSCFLAMPFSSEYDEIFKTIKKSTQRTFYRCVRIDQQQFTKSIIDKIFSEIEQAKLIVFLATDQNPNAFYECGYAVALNKEVITLTDVYDNMPFDIRHINAIAYKNNLQKLKTELDKKLSNLTHLSLQ